MELLQRDRRRARVLRIHWQLAGGFVPVAVFSLVVVLGVGYWRAAAVVRDGVVRHVQAVQVQRTLAMERYAEQVRGQIATLAADPRALAALRRFADATQRLEDHPLTNGSALRPQMVRLRDYLREYYAQEVDARQLTLEPLLLPQRAAVWLQATYVAGQPKAAGATDLTPPGLDASPYGEEHAVWHPVFEEMARQFGWEDVLLVDAQNGRIVYSVAKTPVFQTGLFDGPYAHSNLGALFRQIRDQADAGVRWVDFARHVPLHGRPVTFAGAPIVGDDRWAGAIIVELSPQPFTDIVSGGGRWADIGLGATGDVYLVGADMLMRSESRFVEELKHVDPRVADTGGAALSYEIPVPTVPVSSDADGFSGRYINHRGTPVLGAFGQVKMPDLGWNVFVEIDEFEALRPLARLRWTVGAAAFGMLVLIGFAGGGVAWWVARPVAQLVEAIRAVERGDFGLRVQVAARNEFARLARGVNALLDHCMQLGEHEEAQRRRREAEVQDVLSVVTAVAAGDLSRRARVDGEVAALANAVNDMCTAIGDLLDRLCQVPPGLAELAATVQAGTEHVAREAAHQVGEIGQASAVIHELVESFGAAAQNVSRTEEAVRRAEHLARSEGETLRGAAAGLALLHRGTRAASGKMKRLGERSMEVSAAAGQVARIAADLNMLAVNAAIDEARSGPQGRSSIVATEEVRKLADRADLVRAELSRSLETLQNDLGDALAGMGRQNEQAEQHLRLIVNLERRVDGVGQALAECARSVSGLAQSMRLPAETARGAQEVVDRAADAMGRMRTSAEAAHGHVETLLAAVADWPTPAPWLGEALGNGNSAGNGIEAEVPARFGAARV